MISPALNAPLRSEKDIRLQQLHRALDQAAIAAGQLAELCKGEGRETIPLAPSVDPVWQDCERDWKAVQRMLSDSEDALWHDYIIPAQELMEEVSDG